MITNIKKCNVVILFAAALLVAATAAQAIVVPVTNGSFEDVSGGAGGFTRGVDILDFAGDGVLDGDLFHTTTGAVLNQPTGPNNPIGWTTTESAGDGVAYDARWPGWHHGRTTGPAEGLQALLLDNRGPGTTAQVEQSIGTVASIAPNGENKAVMTFQARMREPTQGIVEDPLIEMVAFFEVNGTEQTVGRFNSPMGTIAGGRQVLHWSELPAPGGGFLTTGTAHLPPGGTGNMDMFPPGPVLDLGTVAGMTQALHMGVHTAELDLTGLNPGDTISIGLRYEDNRISGGCCTLRSYVDNVSVETVSSAVIPEPGTFALAVLALIGLGMFWRRRNGR